MSRSSLNSSPASRKSGLRPQVLRYRNQTAFPWHPIRPSTVLVSPLGVFCHPRRAGQAAVFFDALLDALSIPSSSDNPLRARAHPSRFARPAVHFLGSSAILVDFLLRENFGFRSHSRLSYASPSLKLCAFINHSPHIALQNAPYPQ